LHQRWKANPQSDHFGRKRMSKPMRRDMARTGGALRSLG
jgi:hypothetical protein